MSPQITIKQGASFALSLAFIAPGGAALNLTGATLGGQLRDVVGNLVAELAPAIVSPATGGLATIGPLATTAWPIGRLVGDLTVTSGGVISFSETFGVLVQPAVTVVGT